MAYGLSNGPVNNDITTHVTLKGAVMSTVGYPRDNLASCSPSYPLP